MIDKNKRLDWARLTTSPPRLFPWAEVRAAHDAMDPQVARASIKFAQEELGSDAHACPDCGRKPASLVWLWLTLCPRCATQVQFLLDEEMTELRREGNW